jgi:uncharacterized protein YjbJ (UPF0337 family)
VNRDLIEGNWKQFKALVKEKGGKLTDDNLDIIAGRREQRSGRLQQAYGNQQGSGGSAGQGFRGIAQGLSVARACVAVSNPLQEKACRMQTTFPQ